MLTYVVRANDGTTDSNDQNVVITIDGTNDAPVIANPILTVDPADSAAATLTETDAVLTTTGTLTVTDADITDTVTADVVGVTVTSGPDGGLTNATLEAMLTVTGTPIDDTTTGAPNNLTWTFK